MAICQKKKKKIAKNTSHSLIFLFIYYFFHFFLSHVERKWFLFVCYHLRWWWDNFTGVFLYEFKFMWNDNSMQNYVRLMSNHVWIFSFFFPFSRKNCVIWVRKLFSIVFFFKLFFFFLYRKEIWFVLLTQTGYGSGALVLINCLQSEFFLTY